MVLAKKIKNKKKFIEFIQQRFAEWMNNLLVHFIKNEEIFFKGEDVSRIVQSEQHIPKPEFKLYSVIMGGYSESDDYHALINTLRVYKDTFSGTDDYSKMEVSVYPNYTYIKCGIYTATEIVSDENTVYSDEVTDGAVINAKDSRSIRYNATSTVVNFVYKSKTSGMYSVLFPGDVTAHHHNDIAKKIQKSCLKVTHIIAPHHGSFDTNILIDPDNFTQFGDQYQPLYNLYASLSNATTIISECYNNAPHRLPRGEFIRIAVQSAPNYDLHKMSWFYADSDGSFKREKDIVWSNGVFTTGEYPTPNHEITVFDLEDRSVYWRNFVRDGSAAKADISEHADMPNPVLPPANLFV